MARKSSSSSSSSHSTGLAVWLGLALVVLLLDQFTKVLIVGNFALGEIHRVSSFFDVVRAHNTGAAFSFLRDASGWQRWLFTGLGLVASGVIVWLLKRHAGQTLFCLAVSLILGGALGNVIDRLWHGYVVDFLQFHWGLLAPMFYGGYFPAFNLADSAITAGAIGLILDELRRVRRG